MDLLPKTKSDFMSKDYWDNFFKKRGQKAFEWYGEYNDLCGILHKYAKQADSMLIVGCGNSRLSADLYDVGFEDSVSIDISDTVIAQMQKQYASTRSNLRFVRMDVTKLDYEDGSFSVVIDKGTLDALLPDTSPATVETVDAMFAEIVRVLRQGGRYICISLCQQHLIRKAVEYFSDLGWMVRICRIPVTEREDSDFYLPVFAMVFTKFKKIPGMQQILEISNFEDVVERLSSTEQLLESVQAMQQYGIVRQQLGTKSQTEEHISLDLYSSASSSPRYKLHVVDSPKKCRNKFAIFIVPEGRETEWLFSSNEGRKELAKSAGYERLLVVTLHRDHEYQDGMDGVKRELSTKVMELAPANLKDKQVPFLSIGNDINTRIIRHRGNSSLSGDYVIEDVDSNGLSLRRLLFLSNPSVIQSEVRLYNYKQKMKPDHHFLSCGYYKHIVAGLAFLEDFDQLMEKPLNILLVGLGGGSLAKFIHAHFQNVHLSVVELDPEVVRIAKDWFGFEESERMKIFVEDGLHYIKTFSENGGHSQVVILDVDSKELHQGMICPPKQFVEPDFLRTIDSILDKRGVLILNLVCRNKDLKDSVISDFKSIFKSVYSQPNPEDVNETVYVLPTARESGFEISSSGQLPDQISKARNALQQTLTSKHKKTKSRKSSDIVKLSETLDNLRLL